MKKNNLINDGQSTINNAILEFCSHIPDINTIEDLVALDKIIYDYFKINTSAPFSKFSRSVIEIFESKFFTGCTDIGLVVSSILREKKIPTIYVETANVDWLSKAQNNLPGNEKMIGHIFLEIFICDKWYLYDPTFHTMYDNYDNTNNNYPRRYYVFAKGMNTNSLGVFSTKDERKLALSKLINYDCNEYVDPNYPEINLKTFELGKTSVR